MLTAFFGFKSASEIVERIAAGIDLRFEAEKGGNLSGSEGVSRLAGVEIDTLPTGRVSASDADGTFAPIDILDYIYAVLHRPTYRAPEQRHPLLTTDNDLLFY